MLVLNATLSVDTFFMLSALLNAYGFFTVVDKKKRYTIIDVVMGYVHRYIRYILFKKPDFRTELYCFNDLKLTTFIISKIKNDHVITLLPP